MKGGVSWVAIVGFTLLLGGRVEAGDPRPLLQSVVLPTIEFQEVPLHHALEFLQVRSSELSGSPTAAVNFILQGGEELREIPITLNLRDVSLGQVLWFIGEIGQLQFNVDQFAVIVSKPEKWSKLPVSPVSADREVIRKVNQIVLPKVQFVDVPLSDAVDLLRMFAAEQDPAKTGINLVLLPHPVNHEEAPITLSLSRIPLSEAIRYTAQLASYEVRIENGAVILAPEPIKIPEP